MYRQIQGLEFFIHSPSQYELMSVRRDVAPQARVLVVFTDQGWGIQYVPGTGMNIFRKFASRDAAIDMIASRAQTVDNLA